MFFSTKVFMTAVLISSSCVVLAASETTEIEINVTTDVYVNFTGDLANNVSKELSIAEVNGTITTLGNLGTETNSVGGCDIDISSLNDFRLQHDVDSTLFLHSSNKYSINYSGASFTSGSPTLNLTSCNNIASPMQMATPGFDASIVQAGTYSDILTVTVTTQ